MRTLGLILIGAGIALGIYGGTALSHGYPLNVADTDYPTLTVTGTGNFPWQLYFGFICCFLGALFRFVIGNEKSRHNVSGIVTKKQ